MTLKILVALKPGFTHTNAVARATELAARGEVEILLFSTLFDSTIDSIRYIRTEEKKALEEGMLKTERANLKETAVKLNHVASKVSIEAQWIRNSEPTKLPLPAVQLAMTRQSYLSAARPLTVMLVLLVPEVEVQVPALESL